MDTIKAILDFINPEPVVIGSYILYQSIAWILPAIGLALSAASTWYGAEQTTKVNEEKAKLEKERQGSIDAWYKKQTQPFLETESGKSLSSMLMGQYEKVLEQNRNNAIAGGATAESDIAFKDKVLNSYNNTILGASANDANRKIAANSDYQNQMTDLLNKKEATLTGESQNWVNTMSGISSLLQGLSSAYGEGAFDGGGGSGGSGGSGGYQQPQKPLYNPGAYGS